MGVVNSAKIPRLPKTSAVPTQCPTYKHGESPQKITKNYKEMPIDTKVPKKTSSNMDTLLALIREVCGKSKWKFRMAFAMRGGGTMGQNR